jgi:hypothetical protein
MNLDLTTITNIIPFFFKLGLFTFVFHLIYNCCCEKMEIVKEDKVRYALKINYVLMLSYLIISIAIYALITFRVIILFIFSFGLLSLLGIQNFRPDLLDFCNGINKNSTLKFICRILISIYKILFTMYEPVISALKNNSTPMLSKLMKMGNSDIVDNITNLKNLCKSEGFGAMTDKLTSLENYLCSSNTESTDALKDKIIENMKNELTEEIKEEIEIETETEIKTETKCKDE